MAEANQKFSFQVFKDLFIHSRRITRIMWRGNERLVSTIGFLFLAVGLAPLALSGAQGILINELVDSAKGETVSSALVGALMLFIGIGIGAGIAGTIQKYFDRAFWFAIQEKFELLFLKKRGEIDVALYEDPKHSDLFQKVTENGVWRIHTFTERQLYLFQSMFEIMVAGVILFFAQWWIFLLIFFGTLPEMVIEGMHGRKVWNIYQGRAETRRRYVDLVGYFEHLPKIIELKLFQNIRFFFGAVRDLLRSFYSEELANERKKFGASSALFSFLRELLFLSLYGLCLR
jgi:ABC-type multidrug transport system fused ATPase/permease subunit